MLIIDVLNAQRYKTSTRRHAISLQESVEQELIERSVSVDYINQKVKSWLLTHGLRIQEKNVEGQIIIFKPLKYTRLNVRNLRN